MSETGTQSRPSAVLTGDLVDSRSQAPASLDAAMDILAAVSHEIGTRIGQDLRFTRFRGDGWQVALPDARLAVPAMLQVQARLRAADFGAASRVSAGIGEVETPGSVNLSDARGSAFVASGQGLDAMTGIRMLTISGHGIGPWQVTAMDLADTIVAGWSAPQAEAVDVALAQPGTTQAGIADRLGITRQAVQLRLKGAGWNALSSLIAAFDGHDFRDPAP